MLVDTGAWLAVVHRRDRYHGRAAKALRQLRAARARLVVTDLILAEFHGHLLRSVGPVGAATRVETLLADPLVEEVFADRALLAAAVADWIHRFPEEAFTLTQAVSFATMRSLGIKVAFTFDGRFAIAGFQPVG